MELREYWRIIIRYGWLTAALVIAVGLGSWILRPQTAPQYTATVRFTIGVNAPPASEVTGYDPILTSFQASEYIRDDFVQVIQSDLFVDDVKAQLAKAGATGLALNKGNLSAAVEKQRRLMSMTVVWNNPDETQKIAEAAVKNLSDNNAKYFAQLGAAGASVTVIDKPVVSAVQPGLRERLDIPIRMVIAFFAGIALAFLLDYLDNSVRESRDLEAMGLRVVGEIPKAVKG